MEGSWGIGFVRREMECSWVGVRQDESGTRIRTKYVLDAFAVYRVWPCEGDLTSRLDHMILCIYENTF